MVTTRRTILQAGATSTLGMTTGSLLASTASATPVPRLDRPELQERLDQIAASGSIAALAEFRTAEGIWRGASGPAKLGGSRPARVDGRFRIGSVTKTFTSAVVLQLAGEGRLHLDAPIERWLPRIVPGSGRITVRDLLQHTSGVPDYNRVIWPSLDREGGDRYDDWVFGRYRTFTPQELVAAAITQPPLFEPGTSWWYTNTNYILLGMLIERVTGRRYRAEVTRRMLRPLGMNRTESPGTNTEIAGVHAHGYLPWEVDGVSTPVDITSFNPSPAWAAGGMISCLADLNRFFPALVAGHLLPSAQRHELLANPVSLGEGFGYGLGIFYWDLADGTTVFGHAGSFPGFDAWGFTTEDGLRRIAVSVTPLLVEETPMVEELIVAAFTGAASATRPGTTASGSTVPNLLRYEPSATTGGGFQAGDAEPPRVGFVG